LLIVSDPTPAIEGQLVQPVVDGELLEAVVRKASAEERLR
jgi:hypothetical protein